MHTALPAASKTKHAAGLFRRCLQLRQSQSKLCLQLIRCPEHKKLIGGDGVHGLITLNESQSATDAAFGYQGIHQRQPAVTGAADADGGERGDLIQRHQRAECSSVVEENLACFQRIGDQFGKLPAQFRLSGSRECHAGRSARQQPLHLISSRLVQEMDQDRRSIKQVSHRAASRRSSSASRPTSKRVNGCLAPGLRYFFTGPRRSLDSRAGSGGRLPWMSSDPALLAVRSPASISSRSAKPRAAECSQIAISSTSAALDSIPSKRSVISRLCGRLRAGNSSRIWAKLKMPQEYNPCLPLSISSSAVARWGKAAPEFSGETAEIRQGLILISPHLCCLASP